MRIDELPGQPVQRIEAAGVIKSSERLVVWGIHGGNEYVTAIKIGDLVIRRREADPVTGAPRESVDQLRERVMREVVPTLGPAVLRDSKGSVVAYFVYEGLPDDHGRATAYAQGVR